MNKCIFNEKQCAIAGKTGAWSQVDRGRAGDSGQEGREPWPRHFLHCGHFPNLSEPLFRL